MRVSYANLYAYIVRTSTYITKQMLNINKMMCTYYPSIRRAHQNVLNIIQLDMNFVKILL